MIKNILFFALVICTFTSPVFAQQTQTVPPVDRIIVMMEHINEGIKEVKTTVIDFNDNPTTVQECKKLADDYDEFFSLDGIVICYYKGQRLIKYKI